MKNGMIAILALTLTISLTGCGTAGNSGTGSETSKTSGTEMKEAVTEQMPESMTTEKTAQGTGQKIVIGATGLQEDQFTQVLINGYKDKAKELGIDIIVANSQHSAETETEQIQNMLNAGAKGIIIECVNPDTSAAIAETAKNAGASVFACAIKMNTDAIFASALNDNYDLGTATGKYAAEYFAKHFKKEDKINIGIIAYDEQDAYGSDQRIKGFMDQLKDYNLNIVGRQDGEVSDKAYSVTTDMLTANPKIDLFFCASENGVVGCVNAIEAAGNPNKTVVFGVDCSEQLVDMLKSDKNILQGTTAQDPYTLGTYAVQTVYDYIATGKEPSEKEYHAASIPLNRGDMSAVDKWLQDWNEHAK